MIKKNKVVMLKKKLFVTFVEESKTEFVQGG